MFLVARCICFDQLRGYRWNRGVLAWLKESKCAAMPIIHQKENKEGVQADSTIVEPVVRPEHVGVATREYVVRTHGAINPPARRVDASLLLVAHAKQALPALRPGPVALLR